MEVSELTIWIARLGVLALMYFFVLALILALRADARAAAIVSRHPVPHPAKTPPTPARTPTSAAVAVPKLVVIAGTLPASGSEYSLSGMINIGRNDECTISIANRFVSSQHARIYFKDGRWVVEDLQSTNGTLLNGKALQGAAPLNIGDHLTIGDTEFTVKR